MSLKDMWNCNYAYHVASSKAQSGLQSSYAHSIKQLHCLLAYTVLVLLMNYAASLGEALCNNVGSALPLARILGRNSPRGVQHVFQGNDCRWSSIVIVNAVTLVVCKETSGDKLSLTTNSKELRGKSNYCLQL
jgi:hypothetical protein